MKRILLLFLGLIAQGAFAQTTVTYNHRTEYYPFGYGNGGSVYNVSGNTTEIGMWANYADKQSVVWRPLKTAGDNSGQARPMAVGDEFSITIAATRAYGQIGVALLANPATSTWADRHSNYVAQVNLDGLGNGAWGNWYARYKDGATYATNISGSTNYVDYTIKFKLQSANRMTISVSNGGTTSYIRDVEINGTALPTHYSVYLADDWNGNSGSDIFVKPGYVKSTGVLDLGYFLGSGNLAFTGVTNGIKANSVSDVEINTVYVGGDPGSSVVFSGENTFTGSLTVNANATLSLENSLALNNVGSVTVNGTLKVEAEGLSLATGNTLTLGANSLLAIGADNSFINAFATHNVHDSSTVEYKGTAQQIAALSGSQQYGNLIISGSGQKTLQGSLKANSVTVNSGTSLKAAAGQTLTVSGPLTNNGQIIVENNAALVQQTGSAYSGSGTATVHRNSNALKRLDYTMWSSPVTGQNLLSFSPLTSTNPSRFYTYGILPGGEEGYIAATPASTSFAPATGYLIRTPNVLNPNDPDYNAGNATYVHQGEFTGTLNNGTINVTGLLDHYMAVGNPYASPISVQQFLSQNSSVISGTIYLWRKRNVMGGSASSYVQVNNSGYVENDTEGGDIDGGVETFYGEGTNPAEWILSPGQGFIVGVQSAGNITFTNSMRVAAPSGGSQPFFKTNTTNDEPAASKWWLNLKGANNLFSQALVAYLPQGTLGMDYGYDGALFSDVATQLYSKEANDNYSIQARPQFTDTDVVKLGFAVPAAGQYTLSLERVSGVFAQGQNIYIKDNLLGTTTLLGEEGYSFTSDWGTVNDRFEVVYQTDGALGTGQPELQNAVVVYQSNGAINISTGNIEMNGITIYDTLGRRLYAQTGLNATQATINNLDDTQQVLVIEVATASGKVTKKIVY